MKTILETFSGVLPAFTEVDVTIYNGFYQEFKRHDLSEEDSILFANLSFILTNKTIIDSQLKLLDAEVKQLWDEEGNRDSTVLELHQPDEYIQLVGLTWPMPKSELAGNHSHHLLSRVLLRSEQQHQLNATYASTAPIPTFLGVITHEDAVHVLVNKKRIWNDDPRMSGVFFHGKMMHRVQLNMIMRLVTAKLLDIGGLSIAELIEKLVTKKVKAYEPFYNNAWNFLLDFNVSDVHFTETDRRNLTPLAAFFPPNINGNTYDKPYLFACDPYFLHSYLMTISRTNTPYLSECITQTFCKSALDIQRHEKMLGIKESYAGFVDNKNLEAAKTVRVKLTNEDLNMPNVLSRQAQTFATYGVHAIKFKHIVAAQKNSGKDKKIDKKRSIASDTAGLIQYRSMFSAAPKVDADQAANPHALKRSKK